MCWASRSVWGVSRKPRRKSVRRWNNQFQQLQEQLPREAVLNVDETGWRTNGDKRWIWGVSRKPRRKSVRRWNNQFQQLQEQLPREAVLNVDETGWRTNGDKRWIWALVAQQFVFYVVASSRGAEVLVSLLGTVFRGILCNDRWVVYLTYHSTGRMQLCWAHLKRNILGIADDARSPSSRQFCRDALAIVARVFRLWHRFRGDLRDRRGNPQPLDRQQLYLRSIPLQKKLLALAEAHLDDADREVRNMASALFMHFERLFMFLE